MAGDLPLDHLEAAGFLARLVPVSVLDAVEEYFDRLDRDSPVFTRYPYVLNFAPPESLPDAQSLMILAAPSPAVRVRFTFGGVEKAFIIPPTYLGSSLRTRADAAVNNVLDGTPHRVERARVPMKLLSAMAGLARYGRNNITYYPGLGSFVHLQAFFTTLPPVQEAVEPQMAVECASCRACVRACPTGAISDSRFVIDAGRCLTFHNEDLPPFPDWIAPYVHHTLVGCMRCQSACPLNAANRDFMVDGVTFDADETAAILASRPLEGLPPSAVEKLSALDFREDYAIFARNLGLLVTTGYEDIV